MSLPFKVKAVYEYTSPHEDDLHFASGQIITVTEEEDDDWYTGEYVDASGVKQEGIFPKNFVEKYEPTAPPRPVRASRPKKDAETTPAPVAEPVPPPPAPELVPEPEEPEPEVQSQPVAREPSPPPAPVAAVPAPKPAEVSPPAAPKPAPAVSRSVPPPVSEKPSGGSFKDRIAAFNKAAPPVAPFKPGGLSSGGANSFIRKPFVAPPPSKNAYVPPPREAPVAKVYRREEDPEIAAREAENQEQAEKAGLAASSGDADTEEQPKPTSLKERIALLQKQQAEQAARHAEAAQKKEKPKRPAKKRTESYHTQEGVEEGEGVVAERQDTEETAPKASIDSLREEADAPRRRKSSRGAAAIPGIPPRMPVTDGNEADMSGAGYTTEEPEEISVARDDSDEKPTTRGPPPRVPTFPMREPDVGEEEGTAEEGTSKAEEDEEEEEVDEEDDIDPEVRRKEELRARMAKMSGGMGMHGMFGPSGGMPMPGMLPPKKKKATSSSETRSSGQAADDVPAARAPPVPMIPLPGLSKIRSPEELDKQLDDDEQTPIVRTRQAPEAPDAEEVIPERGAPPIPGGRPAPPPVPKESRPAPPPPPASIPNPSLGSESDDEMSESTQNLSSSTPAAEAPRPPARPSDAPVSPPPPPKRASTFPAEQIVPSSPPSGSNKEKRASRLPPPIPGAAISPPAPVPQTRAPPPPPPTGPLSRASTGDHHTSPPSKSIPQIPSDEEEVTEYDGDYDTDIASAVPHKDALKSHARDDSLDDSSTGRAPMGSPPAAPPPLPSAPAPRGVPPPLPSQPPPGRASADVPRAAPPPPPPGRGPAPWEQDDNEYDPFRYTGPTTPSYSNPAPKPPPREDDLYSSSPPRSFAPPPMPPPQERAAPPPPPSREAAPPQPPRVPPRQSLDVNRGPPPTRRSTDLARMSLDSGFVANDVDLGRNTFWWAQPRTLPPPFQGRKDILCEAEESTSTTQDGKPSVAKDVYVLFQDYSQTIVRAQFNAQDPADVTLEQRHEPPPSRLRQDQLEEAHEQFGRRIYEAVASKRETVVGDGSPQALIQELLKPFADALPPVGTRAYGAVVYGNLANASTQQNDEIRPGDILTLRNAKFQGKHGAMHAKYSMEVGKPDHVAVVAEWDGTKKKVRAWEQGRESKKVKLESFKLDDLRSGEVKVWRVMPRSWVGWTGRH